AERLAELHVSYRASGIVENHGGGRLRAGDRAPDAELREGDDRARRLFELLREPRHVLLLFLGAASDASLKGERIGTALSSLPSGMIDTYRISRGASDLPAELRDLSGLAHAAYGLMEGGVVLVRPDGYLGYRNDSFDPVPLLAYLGRVFSWDFSPERPVAG
ncbi:MAG: hypothetical protein ABIR29_03240, partial [Chthoniobacterales bacterium]